MYKNFGTKEVLKGISLRTQSGKALGLLGRNGAGKTTTIRIVMGVFPPDSGSVRIDGAPIVRDNIRLGYLPEERGLYAKIQIAEQLLYLARLKGMDKKEARKSIKEWLERMELSQYATKRLDVLSKGNQQKIQLIAALIADPEFIVLDEPFSGLDPVNASLLEGVVKDQIGRGKIVLFSSHQMNYVEEFCDEIAILHEGKIVLSGNISEIKRSYDRKKMLVRCPDDVSILAYCKENLDNILVSAERQNGGVLVEMKAEQNKNDFLLALAQQRFDIDSVAVVEPSLNDIFVQYTGDDREGEKENEAV